VGVDLAEAGLAAQAPEELLEAVGPQGDAGMHGAMPACSDEERAGLTATKPQILLERLPAARSEGDNPVFVALAMEDAQAAGL